MKIVVGLGNPGRQYAETRHNVGWMVLDRIADRAGLSGRVRARDAAAVMRGRLDELEIVLVKPTTYMNLSGEAVRKVLARERAPLSDLLVVVDDFALQLGRLRLRGEGSAGGHNGLRSIITELGTQRFARLRVGIGDPGRRAVDHVLSRFEPDEGAMVDQVLEASSQAVEDWAREGTDRAGSRWNGWRPEEPPVAGTVDATDGSSAGTSPGTSETAPGPDRDGIVRTRTGWRKLLGRGSEPKERPTR